MVRVPSDKRQHRRLPATYQVKVVAEDRIIAYPRAINLSLGGILVGGEDRLPVGSPCGVAILLEEAGSGKRIVTRGTVVRSDETGLAIAFTRAFDAGSQEALKNLIDLLSCEGDPLAEPS